ncbi:MAG: hypothetical protein D6725_02810 [Planctomycetota bacterium]|nr:MAG: hypothetical protein D6725_02810 [Planctomycetota bacterium]
MEAERGEDAMTSEAAAGWSLAALCLAVAVSECWTVGRPLRFCLGISVGLLGAGLLIGVGDAAAAAMGRNGDGGAMLLAAMLAAGFWVGRAAGWSSCDGRRVANPRTE